MYDGRTHGSTHLLGRESRSLANEGITSRKARIGSLPQCRQLVSGFEHFLSAWDQVAAARAAGACRGLIRSRLPTSVGYVGRRHLLMDWTRLIGLQIPGYENLGVVTDGNG